MRTKFIVAILLILASTTTAQTLEECQKAAEKNYPLIKQYGLIAQTTELTVSNIQKEWLPKIAVFGSSHLSKQCCGMARTYTKHLPTNGFNHERTKKRPI